MMGIGWAFLWTIVLVAIVGGILYWLGKLDREERARRHRPASTAGGGADVGAAAAVDAGGSPQVSPSLPELREAPKASDDVAAPDDLKKIKGIGAVIEAKLNAVGVRSYRQIAELTAADIDRVSKELRIAGRIERENWVQQARDLIKKSS